MGGQGERLGVLGLLEHCRLGPSMWKVLVTEDLY